MHPQPTSALAHDHIAALHRDAAERRRADTATARRLWAIRAGIRRAWLARSRSSKDAVTLDRSVDQTGAASRLTVYESLVEKGPKKFVIKIWRRLACCAAIALGCVVIAAANAAALNPQPLPPGHVIPKCLPAWACD
jgi:hypothetical protein